MQCRSTSNFLSILYIHSTSTLIAFRLICTYSVWPQNVGLFLVFLRTSHETLTIPIIDVSWTLIRLISRGFPTHFIFQKKRSVITSILEKTSSYLRDLSKRFLCLRSLRPHIMSSVRYFRYGATTIHQACGPTTLRLLFIFARCVYPGNLGSRYCMITAIRHRYRQVTGWQGVRYFLKRSPLMWPSYLRSLPHVLFSSTLRSPSRIGKNRIK
jgi:hypothetical protein